MILVIILIFILVFFLSFMIYDSDIQEIIGTLSLMALIASIIVAIVLCVGVSKDRVIDDRIAMYVEENTKIENQVSSVVNEYKNHESSTFTNLTPESAITLITMYPELKSDDLVKSQIEIYVQNNEKIKALKENKICNTVKRWWLYFGK